jgi:hypothetical protein
MARTSKRLLIALVAALAVTSVAVAYAVTKSSTTKVQAQKRGSAVAKCPKGKTVVGAGVVGETGTPSPAPSVEVNTLVGKGERKVETGGYNSGGRSGNLTAVARCSKRPSFKLRSATVTVPASTNTTTGEGTATARCPHGTRILFGGFRAKRDPGAPSNVFIEVDSAKRVKGERWRVHAFNVYSEGPGTVQALAYCAKVGRAEPRTATAALGQFETGSAVAKCPRDKTARYGGFEHTPGTGGEIGFNAIEHTAPRRLRVTATERFYVSPDTAGLTAIAYCG